MNLGTRQWNPMLLEFFGMLFDAAQIGSSSEISGRTTRVVPASRSPLPWATSTRHCSANCFEKGSIKGTYGTGGFLLMNTGKTSWCGPSTGC